METELQPFFLCLDPDHIDDLGKKGACFVGNVNDLHFSGFDLGQIQDIIDKRKQYFAGALDVSCVFDHIIGNIRFAQDDLI